MTLIEYKNSIVVINAGAQFSASKMPGVDFIIPNVKYLEDNSSKIKGIIFTSSSLEYSGAFPFINSKLEYPRVYGRHFTNTLLAKRCESKNIDFKNEFIPIEEDITLTLGDIKVKFLNTNVSSADSMSLEIITDSGSVVYLSDTRINDGRGKLHGLQGVKPLYLLADSLNCEGGSTKETKDDVNALMRKDIENSKNKTFIATFANNIEHILAILNIARDLKKKIVLESKTIRLNIESAQEIGLLGDLSDIMINVIDTAKYNPKDLIYLVTDEEGKETDTILKIAEHNHNGIKIEEGDTVILATHPIIHNQRAAQNLKDELSRLGAKIIHYKYNEMMLSLSGGSEELREIHLALQSKFFTPIGGCHYMLRVHADIERRIGTPENHIIIPDNGMIIEVRDQGQRISNTREKIETETVVVDGSKIGKLHNVVLKDREILGAQGVFFIISLIDMRGHKLKKAPDLATRGFVFLKESQELLVNTRNLVKTIIEDYLSKNKHIEIDDIKDLVQNQTSKYLMQKTAKEPVIIPIIIRV
jgi:ribonuclease J